MQNKIVPIFAVGVLLALCALLPTPGTQAQRQRSIPLAQLLDSREHPCVSSRVLYILNFGPNGITAENPSARGISRPFWPVQVNERSRLDGYLYVTREDIEGVESFFGPNGEQVTVPRTSDGNPLPIFLAGVPMGGPGQPATVHWMVDQCYSGDPTPTPSR